MRTTEFVPLSFVSAITNENSNTPAMMVLCRAPGDDGWLAIEAGTGVIYNVFDSVAHLYFQLLPPTPGRFPGGTNHPDFKSRGTQSALLARAKWFHQPAGIASVGVPKRVRKMAARGLLEVS